MVSTQSAMIAYDYLFRVTAIVFVVTAPLVFLIHGPKRQKSGQMAMVGE
jgi:hypothetical protein